MIFIGNGGFFVEDNNPCVFHLDCFDLGTLAAEITYYAFKFMNNFKENNP